MMTNNKKVALIILILITIGYIKFAFFSPERNMPTDTEISQNEETEIDEDKEAQKKTEDTYITVFFIGKNENGEELYRAVKRKLCLSILLMMIVINMAIILIIREYL